MLTDNGFRDVMHDFVDHNEPTMLKSKKFRAWRPDKVVTQADPVGPHWRAVKAEIVGKEAIPSFKSKNENASMVAQDGIVRTPSDHFGIVVDLCFK